MFGGVAPPDPFLLYDTGNLNYSVTLTARSTSGLSFRSPTINPSLKTLVFLVCGQSLSANTTPTLYIPTNASVVDQMNVYDGALYDIGGPLLGATYAPPSLGPGNIAARIADTLVTNAKFDRVIIVALSIGSTAAAWWGDTGGIHANRTSVAMLRLAALGIVPGMTGVTFCCLFNLGEQDFALGTSQASMASSMSGFIAKLQATGFNGRIFIPTESNPGETSNGLRSAQASLWDGVTVFSGSDFDSASIGRSSGAHMSDAGAATAAANVVSAMAASGAPF